MEIEKRIITVWVILLITISNLIGQESRVAKSYSENYIKEWSDNNSPKYLNKKELTEEYKAVSIIALSYYPELKDVSIRFRMKNIKTTMKSVPRNDFIFKKKKRRVYHIYFDKKIKRDKGILLKDVPINAQIGIIGHELAHIIDYENKTTMGVVLTGIRYIGPKYRRKLEALTDQETISRGLGWQLMDWTEYVSNSSNASEKYLKYKEKYYYNAIDIRHLLQERQY
jgi:hypothetical protein